MSAQVAAQGCAISLKTPRLGARQSNNLFFCGHDKRAVSITAVSSA
jgi:hypothetical protein